MLTRQEETNQHPRDLVVVQGSSVSEGETESFFRTDEDFKGCYHILNVLGESFLQIPIQTFW